MSIRALTPEIVRMDVGDTWLPTVLVVSDTTGWAVTATVTATVTDPDGIEVDPAPTPTTPTRGIYVVTVGLDAPGRWLVEVTADDHGVVAFAAEVVGVTATDDLPTAADVEDYLGQTSYDTAEIEAALTAERSAQAARCRVGAVYPPDLREALLRRVARNLAMRALPLGVQFGNGEGGDSTRLSQYDPEIRRLEAPYRKLVLG